MNAAELSQADEQAFQRIRQQLARRLRIERGENPNLFGKLRLEVTVLGGKIDTARDAFLETETTEKMTHGR